MSTDRPSLAAANREVTGKKVAALRRDGRLPAVVYGHSVASSNVSVDAHEFELLRRRAGANALIDLSVDGKQAKPVLIHGVQVHPVTRRTVHVDLLAVRMTEELTVDVPLVAIGNPPAVELLSGTLLHPIETLRVRALPDHLPQRFEYSVEGLVDFETSVHVRDLTIPGDVTLLTDLDEVIARVLPPRVEVEAEVVPTAEEEAAEAAEAAEADVSEAGQDADKPA